MTAGNDAEPLGLPDVVVARRVEAMAGYGIRPEDIAIVVGIDIRTLRSRYHAELAGAAIKANAKVAECLFRKATGDGREGVVAAIFWLKTRARWSEASAPLDRRLTHEEALELLA